MGLFSKLFGESDSAEPGTDSAGTVVVIPPAVNDRGSPAGKSKVTHTPVMSDDLRNTISRLKGQKPGPDLTTADTLARMFPIAGEIAREEAVKEAARKKAEAEAMKNPQPGQLIAGKGVFVGTWSPKDRDGRSLNKTFNIFAAPHDLGLDENGQGKKLVIKYNDAVKAVAKIRNLMGHNGANYGNDTTLYNALKDGSYKGEWFIPTREVVNGTDLDNNKTQAANLYALRDTGAFRGTFTTVSGSGHAPWYWSCTERREDPSLVYAAGFTDGGDGWGGKDFSSLSCRPLRAELRP